MKGLLIGHQGMIGKEICKHLDDYIGVGRGDNIFNVKEKVDYILHLGSNCIIRDIIKNPYLSLENDLINFAVLEFARQNKIPKVIYFSSSRVLHRERNPYISSKLLGEELCKAYNSCYGLDYLIVRPECVWSHDDKHERVITNWINRAKNNEDIIVYGDKRKELTPINVKTFVQEYLKEQNAFLNDNRSYDYNLSGSIRTAKEVIDIIKEKYNSNSNVIWKDAELAQPQQSKNEDYIKRINDFRETV